jgi:hypothetical protein
MPETTHLSQGRSPGEPTSRRSAAGAPRQDLVEGSMNRSPSAVEDQGGQLDVPGVNGHWAKM